MIAIKKMGRLLAAAFVIGALPLAHAATLSLVPFNASAPGLDVTVDVTADGSTAVFAFSNNSVGDSLSSSVARIYFESGLGSLGLASGTVGTQVGTDFATSFPGPSLPPSGNNMPNTPWTGNLEAFGAQPSPASNGINVGEMLTISFDYFGTEGDLIAALTAANGNARIAAHILDCSDGESCVASVTPVPVPASLPLMLGALGVIGMLGRRRV